MGPSTLSVRQMKTVTALAEVLIPEGGALPGAVAAGVPTRVAELIDLMPRKLAMRIRALIDAWDAAPLLMPGYGKRFHASSAASRESFIAKARDGGPILRIPYGYLKQVVFMAYGSISEIEDAIGYDRVCLRGGHVHD